MLMVLRETLEDSVSASNVKDNEELDEEDSMVMVEVFALKLS
jgi:hypothetical protein